MDSLVMSLLSPAGSSYQSLLCTLKSQFESGLVLGHPVLYSPWHWVLDLSQEEVHWQPGFLTKHQVKRGFTGALMGGGIVAVQDLW